MKEVENATASANDTMLNSQEVSALRITREEKKKKKKAVSYKLEIIQYKCYFHNKINFNLLT